MSDIHETELTQAFDAVHRAQSAAVQETLRRRAERERAFDAWATPSKVASSIARSEALQKLRKIERKIELLLLEIDEHRFNHPPLK